jgi:hypothetical protein
MGGSSPKGEIFAMYYHECKWLQRLSCEAWGQWCMLWQKTYFLNSWLFYIFWSPVSIDDICTCLIWTVASGGCCEYIILIAECLLKNLWILKEKSMYVKYTWKVCWLSTAGSAYCRRWDVPCSQDREKEESVFLSFYWEFPSFCIWFISGSNGVIIWKQLCISWLNIAS